MRKIIIDTDIGVDDAFALAYAARHMDILGICAVFGNVTVDQAVKNARLFCAKMAIHTGVYRGCSRPLALDPTPVSGKIHGKDGLGDAFDNPYDASAQDGIRFIIDSVKKNPGEITLVAIGPLTNIATALNLAPEIIPLVREVVIMGGAFGTHGHAGNVTPHCEFNIWKDPHAADQVLSSALPVVMLPLDVTHEVLVTGEEIRATGQPVLTAISRGYLDYSLKSEGFEGMALHDTLTLSYLINPGWFKVSTSPVRVVTEGLSRGQTLRRATAFATRFDPFVGCGVQKICLGVEAAPLKAHFLQSLGGM